MVQKDAKALLAMYNPLMQGDDRQHIFKATLHVLSSSLDILLNLKKHKMQL